MKITDFASQAFHNFSSQLSSSWLGRVVEPLKRSPLKWLFPFALLGTVCYGVYRVYSSPSKALSNSQGLEEPNGIPPFNPEPFKEPQIDPILLPPKKLISAAQFCDKHGIECKSPLLEKIKEIEENVAMWKENDSESAWNTRVNVIRRQTTDLLSLIQSSKNIEQVIRGLRSPEKTISDIFKIFKAEIDLLKDLENTKQKIFIAEIEAEFEKLTFPTITTVDDYLESIFDRSDRRARYQHILPARGVTSLEDINLLELRTWDQDVETLMMFGCALEAHPGDQSIQTAASKFLNLLTTKIHTENGKSHIIVLEKYIKLCGDFLVFIKKSPEDIHQIIHHFKNLYLLKQHGQLDAYIDQYKGGFHWTKLKESRPDMNLVGLLVGLKNQHKNINPYGIDVLLKWD